MKEKAKVSPDVGSKKICIDGKDLHVKSNIRNAYGQQV